MALYANGTNYGKSIDPSSANIVDPGVLGGKLRTITDTAVVTASTTLKSSNYFQVGAKLPTGAQVVKIIFGATCPALGTSSFVEIGDEGNQRRYLTTAAGTVMATGGATFFGPNVAAGMNYVVTGTTDNIIRITGYGNDCLVTTGNLNITVLYTVE